MQAGGYRAFLPKPLPRYPPLVMNESLLALLSAADRELGRLDGAIQILPNPDLFVLMFVRREAVLSSQIEGTQSSLRDLLEAEARVHDPKRPADVAEVSNYVAALSVSAAAQSLGITYGAANRVVGTLVREGVLEERTGHARNRRFAYQRYIDLFAD